MKPTTLKAEIDLAVNPVVITPGNYFQVQLHNWQFDQHTRVIILVTPDGKFKINFPSQVERVDIKELDSILFPEEEK